MLWQLGLGVGFCVIGRVLDGSATRPLSLWKAVLDVNYDERMHWAEGHKFESYCCSLFFQVSLTQFRSLPPLFEDTPSAIRELNLASNVLGSKNILWFFCYWCCSCFHLPLDFGDTSVSSYSIIKICFHFNFWCCMKKFGPQWVWVYVMV